MDVHAGVKRARRAQGCSPRAWWIVPVAVHEAALAWGKLTHVLNRRSADPSEVIMSSALSEAWRFLQGASPC